MPFFLGTFKIQRKINTVQIFCIKYLSVGRLLRYFIFPHKKGKMVLPLWRKVFLSFSRLLVTADLPRLARVSCRAAMLLLSRQVSIIVDLLKKMVVVV